MKPAEPAAVWLLLLLLIVVPLNSSQLGQSRAAAADRYAAEEEAELVEPEFPLVTGSSCPSECSCSQPQTVDCSNRKLLRVPSSFPRDTKRIKLERNNITELGAFAFRGLKKLQRIDLSNNNLVKIDPLAFAGGLQSLNSLILYSNKVSQLPVGLFAELGQLQLLLLNANRLKCVSRQLFAELANLNLLSLYDNSIETLANGTFDGLRSIKTIHLGKNPLVCDCNLRWLADYLESNPIETSEATCERPLRNQAKKLGQLGKHKFRCEANEQGRTSLAAAQCEPAELAEPSDQAAGSCPAGCQCDGSTIDCSPASQSESRAPAQQLYELPDIAEDVPVYVTRVKFNDNRIKRIRQTSLFRRLANSRKLDLGSSRIVDIEDNYINTAAAARSQQPGNAGPAAAASGRPERVVFVLLENDRCDTSAPKSPSLDRYDSELSEIINTTPMSACAAATKINAPAFNSPCYNGGSCVPSGPNSLNFSCLCPPGFAGPLCETNIDDCADHQCQNGAACIDGVNSYKCICRDPTTSGEFCEQLSPINLAPLNLLGGAPMALPIVASQADSSVAVRRSEQAQISARSADPISAPRLDLAGAPSKPADEPGCRRVSRKSFIVDGDCQSVRALKLSSCESTAEPSCPGCCVASKTKERRVRMQCTDGASYVRTIELVKRCSCTNQCTQSVANQDGSRNLLAAAGTQEPKLGRLDMFNATNF